jgi:hypothetical protein
MSRTVTVTLDNGEPLQFANVPDSVTPDQIAARAQQETGRSVVTIDGGAKAPAAQAAEGVPAEEPAETTGADTGPGEYYDVPPVSAPDTKGLESELEQYYRSLPKGTAPAEAKLNELATKYGQPPVSNYPEILAFYEKYGTLNPTVAMQGQNAVPPPPPEIEDIVGTVEPAGDAANRARALAKGAFFDFGDEMEAIARVLGVNPSKALLGPGAFLSDLSQSAAQKFAAGEITADEYYRTKNQINAEYNAYAKANPGEALGLELAGGVAGTFIPGVGIVGKGVQLGRGAGALARGAVAGGSTGALSGLGQAETMALSDIAPSVIEQAAIGTAFGGTLGKGFDMLGRRIAPGRSAALPEERRAAEILIDATQGGASPQRSAGAVRAAQASGVPMPFGMVSDELAALSEKVLAKSGPAGRDLARTVVETQAEAGERVAQQAREALPTGRDFFDEQGAITQRLRQIGEQDYQKAFAVGTVRDPQIENLIRNPELASIWKEAQSLARLGGRELNVKLEAVFDEAGALVGVKPTQDAIPDVEALDYFKRALDDQIDAGFRGKASGGKSRAAALRDNIRKPLINRLDELVPEYREARSKYAGDLEVREALDYGRDLLSKKLRPQEVSAQINKMSIAEREAVKTGALQALLEPLEDATRRGNVAQQIIGAGEGGTSKLAKLRSVMDPAEYDFFETALRLERDLYNRASRATGGSRTTPLAEGVARIDNLIGSGRLEDAVNFVMAGPQGRAAALARWVSSLNPGREFGDRVYGQLSNALRAQRPDELAGVLDMLARSESYARTVGTVGDVAAQRIAPAVGGVAPSLVEDRGINPPPAMSIGNAEAETDEAEAAAQAAVDAPLASEEVAPEADNSEPEVSIIMIDGREAIYDPTAGAHIFTDTNEFVDAAPMKRGGMVKGYQNGGRVGGGQGMSEETVNRTIIQMIEGGKDAADIRAYLNALEPGLGEKAMHLDENIAAFRDRGYVPRAAVKFTSPKEDAMVAVGRRGVDFLGMGADLADMVARYTPIEGGYRDALNRSMANLERDFTYRGGAGAYEAGIDSPAPSSLTYAASRLGAIPSAVMTEIPRGINFLMDYARDTTPGEFASDIGRGAASLYESALEDPYGLGADALVYSNFVTGAPAAAADFSKSRAEAAELGEFARTSVDPAERDYYLEMQRVADATSPLNLAGAPISRRVQRVVDKPMRRKRGGLAVKKKGR